MNIEKIKKYRLLLQDNGIILSISGVLSQDLLSIFVESLKAKLELLLPINPSAHNIFNIFIEQAQNILNYSKTQDTNISSLINSSNIIFVGYDNDEKLFYISSSNLIANDDMPKVKERIEYINSLDSEELKSYYKLARKSGVKMHEKGAGLGFIEMAKKSSKKLEYSFESYDESYSFFILKVYC